MSIAVFQSPDHDSSFKLIELAPGVTKDEVAGKTRPTMKAHYID